MELMGNNPMLSHADIAGKMATAYDSIADAYRRETAQYGKPETDEFDKIAAMLPAHAKKVIVDYACGPARDAGHFQASGFKYIGVDVAPAFLRHARQAVPDGEFYQGDFAEVRLPANTASIAWHSSSLQHAKRDVLPLVLKNAFDALEPGGLFYAHYRSGKGESIQISTEYGHPIARFIALYEEAEMNDALQKAGFEILDTQTFDHKYSGLKGQTVKYKSKVIARKPE
jgi:ubiquinone/menaquinone biosynthesis C-methylase UbiE